MRQSRTLSIGWEVPNDSMAVASGAQEHGAEGISLGALGPRQWDIDPRIRQRPSKAPPLLCVDAAGPCGSWLDRYLTPKGSVCWGVTPSLIPNKARRSGQHDPS
jgi:hypothetical protein